MYQVWSLLSRISWKFYEYFDDKRLDGFENDLDWLGISDLFVEDEEL